MTGFSGASWRQNAGTRERKRSSPVELAPQSPDPYFRFALAFLQGRREEEAQAILDTGLQVVPHSPLLFYGQALLYAHKGDYERAKVSAQEAVERRPSWGDAWAVLAELHARRAEAEAADEAFRRALQLDGSAENAADYGEFLLRAAAWPKPRRSWRPPCRRIPVAQPSMAPMQDPKFQEIRLHVESGCKSRLPPSFPTRHP